MSRELDAKIAEKVMEWSSVDEYTTGCGPSGETTDMMGHGGYIVIGNAKHQSSRLLPIPRYTTDPSADYEVLKYVRENWERVLKVKFEHRLSEIWSLKGWLREERLDSGVIWNTACRYEPGDYSKAALKALGEEY